MENNKGIVTLLVVFIFTTLVLGGYLVYDKVLSKGNVNDNTNVENSSTTNEENNEKTTETTYNEEYFDKSLSTFTSWINNYMRNVDNFDDTEITSYLYFYYSEYATTNNLSTTSNDGIITYNVSKKDLDALVLKTFGKEDYKIVNKGTRESIKKIDEDTYQVFWLAKGRYKPNYRLSNLMQESNSAVVEYTISGNPSMGEPEGDRGVVKFYLTKNGENWNVTKVEYNEK